jgi:hypothetical protein
LRWRGVKVILMNEDLPPTQRSRRVAAREKLAARRRRARAIRRRVAGMSLATFLAASGAVLIQLVTGHDPALAHATHPAKTVAVSSGTAKTTASTGQTTTGSSRQGTQTTSSAAATSPSAVTTSAS